MKKSLFYLAIASLTIISLAVAACSSSGTDEPDHQGITEEESQQIALDYLLNSPTYLFDGIDGSVELVETLTARCPSCWVFRYEFESSHAGYGDRTGQTLAQVITSHTASIGVEQGRVNAAIMDAKWDMITQELVNQDLSDEQRSLSVAELMADPQYETIVTIEGEVSLLGELFCPCFELSSGGEKVQVWYGLMVADDKTEMPPVSVEGIENGDWVTVTGKLKQAGQHSSLNDFWAESITVSDQPAIVEDVDPDDQLVGGTPGSCGYTWDAERYGWHRAWDADSFIPADQKPEWARFIPETTDTTISDNDVPQIATATVISVSCEEFQQLEAPAIVSKEIELNTGDTVTIMLCSNPTTGFEWEEAQISDSAVLELVERNYEPGEGAKQDPPVPGSGGTEVLTLQALDAGKSSLTMEYSRPWEGGQKANWTFALNVTVK